MPVSKAQQKATNKYIAKAYDRVNLTLPKGQKDIIQSYAAARGESVNGFIGRAIAEAMSRDNGGGTDKPTGGAQSGAGRVFGDGTTPIPPDAEMPSEAAQKAGQGA